MARRRSIKRKKIAPKRPDNFLVFYKVTVFTALVIVIGAFLIALFSPLISNTVSVLGAFTNR